MGRDDADIRDWLVKHPKAASPYTIQRVNESYDHIDDILAPFGEIDGQGRALDMGCGTAFDTLALATHFDEVVGVDLTVRRIAASRWLARRARVPRVHFVRAGAEQFRDPAPFDFAYCNIMSELANSRRALIGNLCAGVRPGGRIYYAEECEGWAPSQIGQAIQDHDGRELRLRLHQVVNGFAGLPHFRFYLAGSAADVFAEHGFTLVKADILQRDGIPFRDSVWLQGTGERDRSRPPAVENDRDYTVLDPDFAEMRKIFLDALADPRPPAGTLVEQAAESDNRFAPLLILLAAAFEVLGPNAGQPPSYVDRLRLRAPSRLGFPEPDWSAVTERFQAFRQLIEKR